MLGIVPGEMRYYDIYPPLVKSDLRYPLAQGKRMTLEAVKPLGADYAAAMARGFDGRWMDAYPRPRKNPGAHMAGSAYDVHPYVLMNYAENYESVTTLAHEWGHAMHSYLIQQGAALRHLGLRDLRRGDRLTLNEALLLGRTPGGARKPTRNASSTWAPRSKACAPPSSARRCSRSSSGKCMRAWTGANPSPANRSPRLTGKSCAATTARPKAW